MTCYSPRLTWQGQVPISSFIDDKVGPVAMLSRRESETQMVSLQGPGATGTHPCCYSLVLWVGDQH